MIVNFPKPEGENVNLPEYYSNVFKQIFEESFKSKGLTLREKTFHTIRPNVIKNFHDFIKLKSNGSSIPEPDPLLIDIFYVHSEKIKDDFPYYRIFYPTKIEGFPDSTVVIHLDDPWQTKSWDDFAVYCKNEAELATDFHEFINNKFQNWLETVLLKSRGYVVKSAMERYALDSL